MIEKAIIVIVDDRLMKSVFRDIFSTISLAAMVGIGVLLGSDAMQWVGVVMWFLWLLARGMKKNPALTIDQARLRLDEIDREISK